MANINKKHFLEARSCAVVLSVFSRSSVGKIGEGKEKIKRKPILRKVLFREKAPEYHSGAINKEKHLQGRCCERRTQKCLGSQNMLKNAKRTQERFCSMYCAHSSEWGLFGRNTRSAIRGTSSSPREQSKRTLKKKYLKRNRRNVP